MQRLTNDEPHGQITLSGVSAERVGGADAVAFLCDRVELGLCAEQLGVAETALKLTSTYVATRKQFGVPIGSFQAVSHRAADAYIDIRAMQATLWQAAWRLAEGRPAERELAIARIWAADGGHRVVSAAQHLHGGMGFDRDYPLHRFFLATKRIEFTLGGAAAHLETL
ncbi:MAG: hypothetical protein KC616_27030, partial [Myxococcales bacterium]|nr:hypothetical protein [Myxococcales bacterium]